MDNTNSTSAISRIGGYNFGAREDFQALRHSFKLCVQGAVTPKVLKGYGFQGSVLVACSLGQNGRLENARIARSSGRRDIDQTALEIVGGTRFPPPPPELPPAECNYVVSFSFA